MFCFVFLNYLWLHLEPICQVSTVMEVIVVSLYANWWCSGDAVAERVEKRKKKNPHRICKRKGVIIDESSLQIYIIYS